MHRIRPDIYKPMCSMEIDIKAWSYGGKFEELSVAGILWDLYDRRNDDQVNLKLEEVWDIIKTHHKDFTSVYNALIKKYPDQKKEIDQVFIDHGFFADMTWGNRKRDPQEPYLDMDGNDKFSEGDYFVDYAQEKGENYPWMIHQKNEKAGSATNYQRPERTNTVRAQGHYIKGDGNIPYYDVKVTFASHPDWNYEITTENKDGLIYVQVPPDEYDATVTVTAKDVKTGNPLTFTAQQFNEDLEESIERGYYVEHDFEVSGTPPTTDPLPESDADVEDFVPYWETQDLVAKPEDYVYDPPREDNFPLESEMGGGVISAVGEWLRPSDSEDSSSWLLLILGGGLLFSVIGLLSLILVILVLFYLLRGWKKTKNVKKLKEQPTEEQVDKSEQTPQKEVKYCIECGAELETNDDFCPECGTKEP
ncbi:zinc ribbon domain-containing protein [Candidatus Altiarchaeota archaeon]